MFESSGASLHTKAFTVDGRHGFIGSMNFDPRSVSLSSECGSRCYPRKTALLNSRSHSTVLAIAAQRSQSPALRATVEKACCRNGR